MKSEHRHELRTNELAEWLNNLPQWTKKNLRMIIYVSVVVVLAAGSYVYHRYQKDVVEVQKQVELTNLIAQLPQFKAQVLQSQISGFDNSYMLIQTADDLQTAAENAKDDGAAAMALIKSAEVLRMELHYRLGRINRQDLESAIIQAKQRYNKAIEKVGASPYLKVMARFGLGLCEEELGNFEGAQQIYREITTNPEFEGTTIASQAQQRLETMSDYQQKLVFWQEPQPSPAELIKPEVQIDAPEIPQVQGDILGLSDANLSAP
jgi:tetratricopeptide (TPR) repeat protein